MNELIRNYTTALTTAGVLSDRVQRILSTLRDVTTEDDIREMAGEILSDVVSLSGLSNLLLMDINAIIKSGE